MPEQQAGYIFYGRRKGRPLRTGKSTLLENLLPQLLVPAGEGVLDPGQLFSKDIKDVWLEIGFGAGDHLAAQAKANPASGFIGAEPFRNAIANCLGLIEADNLQNVRIHPDDVRPLLDRLAPESFSGIYVLFADPWPKKRHADRRFIGPTNLPKLARLLKQGGELRIATDDPILQEWTKEQLSAHPLFAPVPGLFSTRPAHWPYTRYEQKALKAGRKPLYWLYKKR
jgi:tRNA (guanine-N7-)-methyltransferase